MKINKFLPITLLTGVLMLSACGSETPSGSSYTITETEFLALKARLVNPKFLIEENFTVDVTYIYNGVTYKNKIAKGKDDLYVQGTHFVFDLDVSSYNASTSKANGDTFEYDEDEKTWSKRQAK